MRREPLLRLLAAHQPVNAFEAEMTARTVAFVSANPQCFERTLAEGHITGSAWVVDRAREQAVLAYHAKLLRWLQPGGHADGEADIAAVALREAREETGLPNLRLVDAAILDVDVHAIPARTDARGQHTGGHFHYDIRFLVEGDESEAPVANSESLEVRWVNLHEVPAMCPDPSVLRLVDKTRGRASGHHRVS